MRFIIALVLIMSSVFSLNAQKEDLTYFLPDDITYDTAIPTPEQYLGYQIGEWHLSHDKLVGYMREVARLSPRVTIEEYARSYEQRPLVLLTITSEKNHKNLDKILAQRQAICDSDQSKDLDLDKMPAVVYQGYTIHGNESSGANATPMVLYYLAAGQGKYIDELLDNLVVLLDPCFNPDGLNRFASWVNTHKSKNLVSDPQSREFEEAWPRGRTNHYWFDLNRDWLLVQHPESQGRIRNFHKWKPNILTDHHEMGSNATYFFQPGVPSRTNPITPPKNQELTGKIAEFHAETLDEIGSLYYTRESFDDFYYGKGSTYPDVNACVGILFEQASSRGHVQESVNGTLSFPFTIRNQVRTSLSTQKAALNLRKELLDYQRTFYQTAKESAKTDAVQGYVFGENEDQARLQHFLDLLLQHQIEVYPVTKDVNLKSATFKKENTYVVPSGQQQYRLVKAIFETSNTFQDSLFYDVSSWTLPMAYNIAYERLTPSNFSKINKGNRLTAVPKHAGRVIGKSTYAYLFEWDAYYAPNALNALQKEGLIAKVASRPFSAIVDGQTRQFDYGTIIISCQIQGDHSPAAIHELMEKVARKNALTIYATNTGLTPEGIDLGSPSAVILKQPKVLMIVGNGVNSYDAGEVWHLLDQRYDMQVSMVDQSFFGRTDLDKYNVIVMVDGNYSSISAAKLKNWTKGGGTLISFKRAATWAAGQGLSGIVAKKHKKDKSKKKKRPYIKASEDYGSQVIGGAIFEVELDLTHPIAYGYNDEKLAVFRRGTLFFEKAKNPYAMPAVYTNNPLLSGYISKDNKYTISNSGNIIVSGLGRGRNISFADNTNFRGFWLGTNKLFANAIFFGNTIRSSTTESPKGAPKKEAADAHEHGHQHGHQH